MRKLIAVLFLAALPAFCAITPSVALQWDVRTTGSNNNGGAFDPTVASPGTDYSQQNAAQIAYTDLVISATTTNYTSVANAPTSAVVGNTIQILSGTGCTVGFFSIRSETASSPNFATVDRSMGTAASVCTANLGGSMASFCATYAAGSCTVGAMAGVFTGSTVWMKSGVNYTITVQQQNVNAQNTNGQSMTLEGYASTHGDYGAPAIIATSTASIQMFLVSQNVTMTDMKFVCTASTCFTGVDLNGTSPDAELYDCVFDWSGGTAGQGVFVQNAAGTGQIGLKVTNSTFLLNSTAYGIYDAGGNNNNTVIKWNHFSGGAAGVWDGNTAGNQKWTIVGNTFNANTRGVYAQNTNLSWAIIDGNSFQNQTSENVFITATPTRVEAVDNAFYGGTYGIRLSGTPSFSLSRNNAFGNIGTANYLNFPVGFQSSDVAYSGNPFTSSSNFALTAGATALKGAGFPGVAPGGTGYVDIGALQSQAAASGGSGAYVQ